VENLLGFLEKYMENTFEFNLYLSEVLSQMILFPGMVRESCPFFLIIFPPSRPAASLRVPSLSSLFPLYVWPCPHFTSPSHEVGARRRKRERVITRDGLKEEKERKEGSMK
jgi:hypothetical protein